MTAKFTTEQTSIKLKDCVTQVSVGMASGDTFKVFLKLQLPYFPVKSSTLKLPARFRTTLCPSHHLRSGILDLVGAVAVANSQASLATVIFDENDTITYDYEREEEEGEGETTTPGGIVKTVTDEFCSGFIGSGYSEFTAQTVGRGELPEGVDPNDPRVKEIIRRCAGVAEQR